MTRRTSETSAAESCERNERHNRGFPIGDKAGLARFLKEARAERQLNQANLSKRSSVSTRTIVALEREERDTIQPNVLLRLAVALEVEPSEIFGAGKVPYSDKLRSAVRSNESVDELLQRLPQNVRQLLYIALGAKQSGKIELLGKVDTEMGELINTLLQSHSRDIAEILLHKS